MDTEKEKPLTCRTYSAIRAHADPIKKEQTMKHRIGGTGFALASLVLLGSALPAVATEPAAPPPGAFQAVGPMTISRFAASLTLLADGSVLVAGGGSPRGAAWKANVTSLASTERFDPKTNQF